MDQSWIPTQERPWDRRVDASPDWSGDVCSRVTWAGVFGDYLLAAAIALANSS
jgi:hypothetical protein